jgi:hypothetical protein
MPNKTKKDKWFYFDLYANGVIMFAIYFSSFLFIAVVGILAWVIYNGGG